MKIWVKFLIGSVLGMTIGFLLPSDSEKVSEVFQWLERLAIGIGRYTVVPVLVFSLTIAVYELRNSGQFWIMILKNFAVITAASFFVITLGILVTLIVFHNYRIPIETVEQIESINFAISANIIEVFPSNMFSVLAGSGTYLFPICVFAFFLGMGLNFDRNFSKPVISLVDSLSRIFYHIAAFFTEIMGLVIIVLSAYWAIRYHGIIKIGVYKELVVMLGIFSIVLCFGILPLFLYFLKPKVNPWMVLYGSLGPALAGFFSGDINFSIPVLMRHSKENFGVKRRSSALSLSLFTAFCRCGSAMVAAAAFIVIIKSYSPLGIAPGAVFVIGFYSFLISFLLARHPGDGAYIALAVLCINFSGGLYRADYLILKPLAFYLAAIGVFIDVMINAFGTYVIARMGGFTEEKNIVRFI